MRIIAVIQARMGSTRFPGKTMADLSGKPMLQWVIDAAKKMDVEEVVIVTSNNDENAPIRQLAIDNDVRCLYWDKNRETENEFVDLECFYWYYHAAKICKADYVVRICGDQPFTDPELTNKAIYCIKKSLSDYVTYKANGKLIPYTNHGIFTEIFSIKKMNAIMQHVTVPFYLDFENIYIDIVTSCDYGLTIDYPEDLEKAKHILFLNKYLSPSYKDIEYIMNTFPELRYTGKVKKNYEWQNA